MYLEKIIIQKDTCTPVFIAALFTIAKTWKQPKCPPTDEWIKNRWYIFLSHKKNEMIPFVTIQINLEIIILSEVSQTGKDKYHMIALICGILKKGTNKLVYRSRTADVENKLMVYQGIRVGGINWKIETDIYTLLYIKEEEPAV